MHNITCPVYCICLPNRKENTELFFNALGLSPIYTDVVLKDSLDRHSLIESEHITPDYDFNKHRGRIACNLSHKNALLEFKKSHEPYCIIFEDDNKIPYSKNIGYILKVLKDILPLKIWNLINLSPCWSKCLFQKTSDKSQYLKYPLNSLCRNAYAITQEGATQYLTQMFPLTPKQYAGDHIMRKISKGYDCRPRLFKQNRLEHYTTLGNEDVTVECTSHLIFEKKYQKYIYFGILLLFLLIIIIKLLIFKKK